MTEAQRVHRILLIVVCLILVKGLLYGLLIPYDRAPDEHHHFRLIKAKHLQLSQATPLEKKQAAAQLGYLRYYLLRPAADPLKYSPDDYADEDLPDPPSSFQLHYLLSAWLLKVCDFEQILPEIYLLRGFSILCGVCVVWIAFLTARELFAERTFLVITIPALIAFIPQFSAMNGVISDDKLAEVFTALFFWLTVKIMKNGWTAVCWHTGAAGCRRPLTSTIVTACTALLIVVLALLSKRTAMFLLPCLPIFVFVYSWRTGLGLTMHLSLVFLLVLIAIGGVYLMKWLDQMEGFFRMYSVWKGPQEMKEFLLHSYSVQHLQYYAKFLIVIYWSFWAIFGYMSVHIHHFWYLLTGMVQGLSVLGLGKMIFQVKLRKITMASWKIKILYLFGVSIFVLLVIVMLRSIVFRPDDPLLAQGRRFFTVVIPICTLTMCGLEQLLPRKFQRAAGIMGLFGLIVLDVVCLSNYILLHFHNRTLF